jgi:hypothetical protein
MNWVSAAVHDFFPHPNLVVTTLLLSGSGSSTLKVVSVVKKPPVMPKSNKGDVLFVGSFWQRAWLKKNEPVSFECNVDRFGNYKFKVNQKA